MVWAPILHCLAHSHTRCKQHVIVTFSNGPNGPGGSHPIRSRSTSGRGSHLSMPVSGRVVRLWEAMGEEMQPEDGSPSFGSAVDADEEEGE